MRIKEQINLLDELLDYSLKMAKKTAQSRFNQNRKSSDAHMCKETVTSESLV